MVYPVNLLAPSDIYMHMRRWTGFSLTHWGRVTHICVGNLTIIGPDNGLSPGRRQAITRTNAVILLIEPLRTNFSEVSIEIHTFSFMKMYLKMSSAKWRPFCLGLIVLILVIVCLLYGGGLNQRLVIVQLTFRNKCQINFNRVKPFVFIPCIHDCGPNSSRVAASRCRCFEWMNINIC